MTTLGTATLVLVALVFLIVLAKRRKIRERRTDGIPVRTPTDGPQVTYVDDSASAGDKVSLTISPAEIKDNAGGE